MVSKVRWRAVLLTGIGLMAGMLPVKLAQAEERGREVDSAADHAKGDRGKRDDKGHDRGPVVKNKAQGVERYNPYIDGDRVVFTQVTRRAGGSTASIWARDLATGRESLVADVGTGEPLPVTSAGWTAWSEAGPGVPGRSVVRARANSGGPVLDVFSTAYDGQGFGGEADELLSVDLSGDRLVTTNGIQPPGEGKQLVRFTLPSTQPTYVDVMTTAAGPAPFGGEPGVAQSGATSVIALGNSTLFSVVDGAGVVTAAPAGQFGGDGCFVPDFGPVVPSIDDGRVAVAGFCFDPTVGFFNAAVITCTLPCATVDPVFVSSTLGFDVGLPPRLVVRGDTAYWSTGNGFSGSAIYAVDLAHGGPAVELRRSSGAIGPRVSVAGNRLVWDETIVKGGVQSSDIYVMDLTTGATTALRPNRRDVVSAPPSGPIRLAPDVRGNTLAYTEVARDGSSAGIWQRALAGGAPTLVSNVATDGSAPRLGTGWMAWNTRDPGAPVERVVATSGPGGALVDVYQTDLAGPSGVLGLPGQVLPVGVDVSGSRVATLGWTVRFLFGGLTIQPMLYSTDLPGGALTPLTPFEDQQFGPQLFGPPHTEGNMTAIVDQATFPGRLRLVDTAGNETALPPVFDAAGQPCFPQAFDLTATTLVAYQNCFFTGSALLTSCALPCASGFTRQRPLVDATGLGMQIRSLTVSGNQVAMTRSGQFAAGRYGSRFGSTTEVIVTDVTSSRDPVVLINESGAVSEARVDGTTVVWSVDRYEGTRTGTVTVFDLRRNRSATV